MDLTPQERAKDKRLWKNYRWTLAMYHALERVQDYKCAGCGRKAGTMPLNVDHEHFKISARRLKPGEVADPKYKWEAYTVVQGSIHISTCGETKIEAEDRVRERALPLSVRGLLCAGRYAGCNRLLGRVDKLPWLKNMTHYLEDPPARKVLPPTGSNLAINT